MSPTSMTCVPQVSGAHIALKVPRSYPLQTSLAEWTLELSRSLYALDETVGVTWPAIL